VSVKKDSDTTERDLRTHVGSVLDNSEVPSHSCAHEYLGKLSDNQERSGLAVEQYKTALALDSENKSVREILKRLGRK
jgi:hypothetical protein